MDLSVWYLVGAVAVHCANGIWGTVADGLFYGGGLAHLGVQCMGAAAMFLVYRFIDATVGLRVSAEEEIMDLDVTEHGLDSAYADFLPVAPGYGGGTPACGPVDLSGLEPMELTSKEKAPASVSQHKLTRVNIICKEDRFPLLRDAMAAIGVTGMTVSSVMDCGTQMGKAGQYRGVKLGMSLRPCVQVDIVVSKADQALVVAAAEKCLRTGSAEDGKIFPWDMEHVVKVPSGEMDSRMTIK